MNHIMDYITAALPGSELLVIFLGFMLALALLWIVASVLVTAGVGVLAFIRGKDVAAAIKPWLKEI